MATEEQSLEILAATFLADLAHTNHSPQTRRAYSTDLAQLCAFHQGPVQAISAEVLRNFFMQTKLIKLPTQKYLHGVANIFLFKKGNGLAKYDNEEHAYATDAHFSKSNSNLLFLRY